MTALAISLRRLRNSPGFVVVVVLTLGVGLGSLTAVYSAIDAAFLRPPDLPQVDRIAAVFQQPPPGALPTLALSRLEFGALQDRQTSFAHLAGTVMFRQPLAIGQNALPVVGEAVTGHYFRALAVPPVAGRLLSEVDQDLAAPEVVVLSEALWERLFARDERAVGQPVEIGGIPFTIIGVVPRRYRGPLLGAYLPTDIWISLEHASRHRLVAGDNMDTADQAIHVIGRLKEDATMPSAASEIAQIGKSLDATASSGRGGTEDSPRRVRQWTVSPFTSVPLSPLNGSYFRPVVTAAAGLAVVLVLVICSNLGTLTLARLMRRSQELAIRRSLGASTRHIVTELLLETAILSVLAGVLGLVIARILMILLATRLSVGSGVWIQIEPQLDLSVLGVLIASGSLGFLAVGVVPVVQATRRAGVLHLKRSRRRGRRTIVAGQTAAALVFLSIALASTQDLLQRLSTSAGFALDGLAIARTAAVDSRLGIQELPLPQVLAEFDSRLTRIADVAGTAAVSSLPGGFGARAALVSDSAGGQPTALPAIAVSPGALEVMGLRLMSGRSITTIDTRSSPLAAVLSETAADRLFGTSHVLGEQLRVQIPAPNGRRQRPETFVVVGTVKDTIGIADARPRPEIFIPMAQVTLWDLVFVARTTNPEIVLQPLRGVVQSLGPRLPVVELTTGRAERLGQSRFLQFAAVVVGIFGGASIVLALAGVVGLVSEFVTARTREIALCLALGATHRRMAWEVGREALTAVGAGMAGGLLMAVLFRRASSTIFLGQLSSFDPSLLVLTAFIAFAAVAACWWPLKRVLGIAPAVALRQS